MKEVIFRMSPAIEAALIILAIIAYWKFAGVCKKFTLSASFKKVVYGLTVVALLALNFKANTHLEGWMVIIGFITVFLFTIALMSETSRSN